MDKALQTAGMPAGRATKKPALLALAALGVVYGDIGTSTLYGLKQAVEAGGTPTPESVLGIVSVILWSLLLVVGLKYAILILRADNHGEGGIVAKSVWGAGYCAKRARAREAILGQRCLTGNL